MSDGWVTVGELPGGQMFETRDGVWWRKMRGLAGMFVIYPVCGNEDDVESVPADTPARAVTPVHVSPGLDSTLRALLLAALESGDQGSLGALGDRITDLLGDRDMVEAIRRSLMREIIKPDGNGRFTLRMTAEMVASVAGPDAIVYQTPPIEVSRLAPNGTVEVVASPASDSVIEY